MEAPSAESADPTVDTGNHTVFVVEDDAAVRSLVVEVLQSFNYNVIEAETGDLAISLWPQIRDDVDLLLTDMVMPGMGGRELAQHLITMKPDLRVLFMSGFTDDVGILAGHEQGTSGFLQKPFTPEVLARTVRKILDAASSNASQPTGNRASSSG